MEPEKSSKLISMKEVEEHNSMGGQKSIWMVIHDKVYDVTNFLDEVNVIATYNYSHRLLLINVYFKTLLYFFRQHLNFFLFSFNLLSIPEEKRY